MSFSMFKKHKRTPAELAVKLNASLQNLEKGGAEKARATAASSSRRSRRARVFFSPSRVWMVEERLF